MTGPLRNKNGVNIMASYIQGYDEERFVTTVNIDRGCQEILQLQYLDQHEDTCGFTPAVCTNQGCGAIVNQRDLIHHESEACEIRKLKCHSCEEMIKTMSNIEKRMTNVETRIGKMETKLTNVEKNMADKQTDIEGKVITVDNKVTGLQTALIEGFNELKDVLLKIKQENTKILRNTPSGDRVNIIVLEGHKIVFVEKFDWREKTWSPLQSMPQKRYGATSFVYNNDVRITGGCGYPEYFDDMISMNVDSEPDLSTHWSDCPVKLPTKLGNHSSVLYNTQLLVTGGYNYDANLEATSNYIHEVQLVPPNNVNILSRMPEPRQSHNTQIFEDSLLIAGGTTTGLCKDNLSSVVLYDIKKNDCKQLAPLRYEVSDMATVKWGDNIVVIGGADKRGQALNTVIIYNVKTEQSQMLPPMKLKRCGCTAVFVRNHIVVLGGYGEQGSLKSVEAFNFENNIWQELPEMCQGRFHHTAVAV